jgi:hypothetical protein
MVEVQENSRAALLAGQLAIWHDIFYNPEGESAYNIGVYWEFIGSLSADHLADSVEGLVDAAPVLRSRFVTASAGELPQVELASATTDAYLRIVDVSREPNPPAAARDWMEADARSPLPLDGFPMFRIAVLKLAPDWHYVYMVFHHIIVDGVGVAILMQLFATLLESRKIATRTSDHAGYRAALDAYSASNAFKVDGDYWRALHASPSPRVSLSMHPPMPVSARPALRKNCVVQRETLVSLASAAHELKVSLTELLFASVVLFVQRMTGAADIPVGLPVHGRPGTLRDSFVGMCMNVLPLRFNLEQDQTVKDFLRSAVAHLREGLAHQSYRYEMIKKDVGRLGDVGLFAVSVNIMRGIASAAPKLKDVQTNFYALTTGPIEDISVLITDGADGAKHEAAGATLLVEFRGNPGLYADWELEGMVANFSTLLGSLPSAVGAQPSATEHVIV